MSISYATSEDIKYLEKNDTHINLDTLKRKISEKEIIIAKEGKNYVGWLRFGYFWDEIPIMNLIILEYKYRRKGIGSKIVRFWENEMKKNKYELVITSTQANEEAQHFYRKLGYHDVGTLFEINKDGSTEIFLSKKLHK